MTRWRIARPNKYMATPQEELNPAPDVKAKMLSHLVEELSLMLKAEGDMEVFTTNEAEGCFDGVGGMFVIQTLTGLKALALMRSDVVIKI
jgi:hypothetical protein